MPKFDLSIYKDPVEEVFWNKDEFTEVTKEEIYEKTRWSVHYSQILKYKDGTLWQATWSRGATEYQDEGSEDLELLQVVPKEVLTTVYEVV